MYKFQFLGENLLQPNETPDELKIAQHKKDYYISRFLVKVSQAGRYYSKVFFVSEEYVNLIAAFYHMEGILPRFYSLHY
jgi:hypothetical protein